MAKKSQSIHGRYFSRKGVNNIVHTQHTTNSLYVFVRFLFHRWNSMMMELFRFNTIWFDCVCYYKRIEYFIRFKFDLIFTLSMNLIFFGFVTDNNNRTSTQFWYVHRCTFTVQTTSYCHPNNREQQRSPVMLHTSSIFYIYDYSFFPFRVFSSNNFSHPYQFLSSLCCRVIITIAIDLFRWFRFVHRSVLVP